MARDFYNNSIAERVCQAACQLGRALGLHRSRGSHQKEIDTVSHKLEKERERLFWVLYTLDKQRVFMTGQPCDLYAFDSDYHSSIEHVPTSNDDVLSNSALNYMMVVWENIYINFYASKAASAPNQARARHMQRINNLLEQFGRKHVTQLNDSLPSTTADTKSLQTELKYGYHILQILLLRCEQDSAEKHARIAELARASLEVIIGVCKESATTFQLALLAKLIRNYPIVAFIELIALHLTHIFGETKCHTEVKTDIQLLQAVCDQIEVLQFESLTHHFFNQMYVGLSWGLSLLLAVVESLVPLNDSQQVLERGQYSRENRSCQSSATLTSTDLSPPAIPDILNACSFDHSQDHRHYFSQASFQNSGQAMDPNRAVELTDDGLFTLETGHTDLLARPLSFSNQYGLPSFSTSLALADLNAVPTTTDSDWCDFNSNFLLNLPADIAGLEEE